MVQVIEGRRRTVPHPSGTYHTGPLIHIHHVERNVFGNGIAIHVYGEMRIAAGEYFYAREMKLNTIQVLNLTPEIPGRGTLGYMAQKYIYHKGEYDNYGSIDIYDDASTWQSPGTGPSDGSVWLDFEALGE